METLLLLFIFGFVLFIAIRVNDIYVLLYKKELPTLNNSENFLDDEEYTKAKDFELLVQ